MMTKHEAESETELSLIVLWSMINSEAINFRLIMNFTPLHPWIFKQEDLGKIPPNLYRRFSKIFHCSNILFY